ncbi:MAG: hypothetical protein OEZ57_06375 [Nitrospirota bacterium]|nr:hypothetical protein [Nitrospirota bacterium]MDH5586729.1 hypothetical protein [Nitrospirota bacterium]MDH5774524.1 hypothetical protein [Nitrospirota bacterium]
MSKNEPLQPGQVVDTLGELISSLAAFAAKVPAASRMTLPGGIKPAEEAVEVYEEIVYRFRDRAGATYKPIPPLFVKSLEAFEAGKVFDAVPPLLQCIEQLVDLHNQETIKFTHEQQQRMRDYHRRLEKIVPEAKQSEVDLPTPDSY